MAQQDIIIGAANAKAGDTLHSAFTKTQDNFTDLYSKLSIDQQQMIYVTGAGNDINTGLNLNEPMLTIPAALVKAALSNPSESNQIVITGPDATNFTGAINGIEWVHIVFPNASYDGTCDIADNTIVKFRRMMRSTVGGSCIKKTTGTGFAKAEVDLLIVGDASQNGFLLNSGVAHLDAGVISVTGGIGIKAKNGSRVSFDVKELQLLSSGVGLGTQTAGGDANSFSGNILYAKDDGTGVLIETKVDGDTINIQGGSFDVNTLYDLGVNSTLNVFSNESTGNRIADPTAEINATVSGAGNQTITRSSSSQLLPLHDGTIATEAVIDFGTMTTKDFDIAAGVIEVLTEMSQVSCSIEIHLNKVGAQIAEFNCWLEASADGVVFIAIDESLRREVIDKDGSTNFVADFSFNVLLPVGSVFRMVATNSGFNTLTMQSPPAIVTANGGANGFAKTLRLVKIR